MDNKIFPLVLVFITVFMMITVLGFYYTANLNSYVVSPMEVFGARDDLDIFEMREINLIKDALDEVNEEFGTEEFEEAFREIFFSKFLENSEMKEFLFNDLVIGENEIREQDMNENLLDKGIYTVSSSNIDSTEFVFARDPVVKVYALNPENDGGIAFPMTLYFEFSQKYLITKKGSDYNVEKIE